jgi:hypothetical protein
LVVRWSGQTVAGLVAIAAIACGNDKPESGPTVSGDGQAASDFGGDAAPDTGDASVGETDASKVDVGPSPAQLAGIGKPCLAQADCPKELFCQDLDAVTGQGICTKLCKDETECLVGSRCNPRAGKLICTLPRYCNPCAGDADCSSDAPLCLKDKNGQGFCTMSCYIGDSKCGAGSSCVQFGESTKDFACRPDYGACKGNGEHCSPCATAKDCGAGTECYLAKSGEHFCAQLCDPVSAPSCPKGFACAPAGGSKGYCFRQAKDDTGKDALVATCAKGDKGYCDACNAHYECASGKCVSKEGKKFCGLPSACATNADCPYGGEGTFCVPTNVGNNCAPPIGWHCTGYKACLKPGCKPNETCDNGICKAKPGP